MAEAAEKLPVSERARAVLDAPKAPEAGVAAREFVAQIGRAAAFQLEACVHCGQCAQACHFYQVSQDPRHTPVYKLRPMMQAYAREAAPFSSVKKLLGLAPAAPTVDELQEWSALLYDSCNLCGRCTLACPMGIDIADLVKQSRHGMYKAGLVPDRLELMDRTTRLWGSPATPAEDFADIIREAGEKYKVPMRIDEKKADYLLTCAPAELTEHTKALADAAKILNTIGASWTYHSEGFEASNIGFLNGDIDLQEKLTRKLIDTAVKIGAHTLILPECGHAYGAARWEAARWYGGDVPVRVIHMTEFLDEAVASGRFRLNPVGQTATLHDPCQLVRRGGVMKAPRNVIAALGIELRELEDHGMTGLCCGGGGGVVSNMRADPIRYRAFELKRRQVDDTGAERFVTACGQCRITLNLGARKYKWDKEAESLLELVADNIVAENS
jgi:Fe-S oxidoreductase